MDSLHFVPKISDWDRSACTCGIGPTRKNIQLWTPTGDTPQGLVDEVICQGD